MGNPGAAYALFTGFSVILAWKHYSGAFYTAVFTGGLKMDARYQDFRPFRQLAAYKFWGLMIFVAIPLPGTGVWTGCLAASLIEMDFKRGMLSVILGSAIAGVIVTALCALGLMAVGG